MGKMWTNVSRICCDRTRGNSTKLKPDRFKLERRKMLFTVRVVKHVSKMPREMVDAPFLETSRSGWTGL